jgi:hypothetical protein
MEVPPALAAPPAEPVGVGGRSLTAAARRRSLALVSALLPWRRRRDDAGVVADS